MKSLVFENFNLLRAKGPLSGFCFNYDILPQFWLPFLINSSCSFNNLFSGRLR